MATWYAWSNIRNGGEIEMRKTASGQDYRVVLNREETAAGEKVTKKGLKVSDEEWDLWVEQGVVRPYPLPKDVPVDVSPAQHVVNQVLKGQVQLDPGALMEMSLLAGMASGQPTMVEEDEEAPGENIPVGA